MAKGYRIEPEGAVASTVDASVSTPEWARAVAKSYDRESDGESDGESEEEDDELSDPFAHVAKQKGEWDTDHDDDLVELSYANKKRLLLEFSRDREDLLRRLSERELYVLADHPLRKDQGNAGGRKVVNAMKRLRARLGVDASYFAGQCAALGGGDTMGECTFSDVTRLLHVFADDVAPQFRPDRAAMQSLLRRISALADTEKLPESTEPTTTSTTPAAKVPRWMERRSRRPARASTRRTGTSDRVRRRLARSVGDGGEDAEVGASNPAAADAVSTIAAAALTASTRAKRGITTTTTGIGPGGAWSETTGTAGTAPVATGRTDSGTQTVSTTTVGTPGGRGADAVVAVSNPRAVADAVAVTDREWATGTSITDAEREPRAASARTSTASTSRTTAALAITLAATRGDRYGTRGDSFRGERGARVREVRPEGAGEAGTRGDGQGRPRRRRSRSER